MEVRVLGPLEVSHAGRALPIGGFRQRLVLGVLLVRPNQGASADRLVDAVWGENPPRTARKTLQVYISRLRNVLGSDVIKPAPTGYTLQLRSEELDAARFEELATEGNRLLTVDSSAAARVLHEALAIWRGAPWGDLGYEPAIQPEAQRLRERRLEALEDRITADLDTGHAAGLIVELEGLIEQHPWRERFRAQLMLALYRSGRQADALRAFQSARSFLGEEMGIEPSPELRDLEEKMLLQDPTLAGPAPATTLDDWRTARNPYKGLRPFRREDHTDFFGRSDLIDKLQDRIGHDRFIAVVGASGSGKSSVVMAGLLSQLHPDDWIVATMVPGRDPFRALEAALGEIQSGDGPSPHISSGDELGIIRTIQALVPENGPRLLLVIDQFEELLHQVAEEATRTRFIRNLAEAVEDPLVPLTVLITLRADFFERALEPSPLGELIGTQLISVLPLRPHELEAAAVIPARHAGVHLDPELIAELVGEMTDQPGALPLFQYALTQLFDERRGPVLTRSEYVRLGGLTGALSRQSEKTYQALTPEGQTIAHQVFMRLVTVDPAGVVGRRRLERASLESLDPGEDKVTDVLNAFDAARLLTFDRHPVTTEATVEVAHEALLREWPRMRRWLDSAREDLRLHSTLVAAVGEWGAAGRDADYLLTGSRLDLYQEWRATTGIELTELERAFLDASAARRDAEWTEEETRQADELRLGRRSVRRLRALVVVVSVAALIAAGLTLFAANRSRAAAASEREARARELANASLLNLEADAELALLLAIESVEVTRSVDGSFVAEAEMALHQAVSAGRLVAAHRGEWTTEFHPNGDLFVGGREAVLLDPITGESVLVLPRPDDGKQIESLAVSPDGKFLATGTNPGNVGQAELVVWNAASGAEVRRFATQSDTIAAIAFGPDGRLLASISPGGGGIRVWDVASGTAIAHAYDPSAWSGCCPPIRLEFSPDGSALAATTMVGDVIVLSPETGDRATLPTGHEGPITGLRYLPDGTGVVTSGWDQTVRLMDSNWAELATIDAGVGRINALDISDDGRYMLTGGDTGKVQLWELNTLGIQPLAALSGHRAQILDVTFDPEGRIAASVAFDGEVRIWDASPFGRGEIASWPGDGPVAFSPDGTMVAVADQLRREIIVRSADGGPPQNVLPVASHVGGTGSEEWGITGWVAFSPDGRYVATTSFGWQQAAGSLSLWEATSETPPLNLFEHPFLRGPVVFGGDGLLIAAATCTFPELSTTARVIETASGVPVFTAPPGLCGHAVDLDPSGEFLAVVTESDTSNVEIWELATGESVARMTHQPSMAGTVQYSPDGTRLLTVGADGFGRVWEPESGNSLLELEGHTGPVDQGVWVSDDTVVTASSDGTARVWDARSGENLLTLALDGTSPNVAISPDRSRLATSSGGVVRIWAMDLDELLRIATERLSRSLSPAECVTFHFDDCPSRP